MKSDLAKAAFESASFDGLVLTGLNKCESSGAADGPKINLACRHWLAFESHLPTQPKVVGAFFLAAMV